jgi:integrase
MAKRGLTDIAIHALKPGRYQGKGKDRVFVPGPWRREEPDGAARGLYHIVQPNGRLGACVRFRFEGRNYKLTLAPGLSLAAKRKAAGDAWCEIEHGRNPCDSRKEAVEKAALAKRDTLLSVCTEFYKRDGATLRSRDAQLATLKRHAFTPLGARPIASIKRKDIVRLLDSVTDKSGPRESDMVLAHLRRIMNWHAVRDGEYVSPIVRGMAKIKPSERARSRILSDGELCAVVITARELKTPFASFVLYLLYSAARRSEASHMRFDEISDNGDWLLPAARNKTKRDLLRPLPQAARQLLTELPRICSFVFTTDGVRPLSGYSKFKKQFDSACGVTGWTLHDLRRTARSLMARAGVPNDHAEECLGHVRGGVAGVYNRHAYYAEKKQALEALAALFERIVNPPSQGNVVELRRG